MLTAFLSDNSQNDPLMVRHPLPDPVEVHIPRRHYFILYNIHIVNRNIMLALRIAVTHNGMTDKLDQIRLITGQMANFINGIRIILHHAPHRAYNQLSSSFTTEPGKLALIGDVEKDRSVFSRQFFDRMRSGKHKVHKMSMLHYATHIIKDTSTKLI